MSVSINEPQAQAQACVIWMHGLGADSSDMMGLAKALPVTSGRLHHVFLDAPKRPVTVNAGMVMPAWYDILGTELIDREDRKGIEQSELLIREAMEKQLAQGFTYNQIFLAGFSQGGAMALHTALHTAERLAGVIALSGYLPLAAATKPVLDNNTPFFIGAGQFDPLVLPKWTLQSKEWLSGNGYGRISYHLYPMEHSVCLEEVRDLGAWLGAQVDGRSE